MKTADFFKIIDERFPSEIQEDFDNSGSQILFSDFEVRGVLVSLDIDESVIDEAMNKGCNVIVTHHPLIFRPLKRIDSCDPFGAMIQRLVKEGISVYSIHTNLDKVFYSKLSEVIGFSGAVPLLSDGDNLGIGSYVSLERAMTLASLLKLVKERLGCKGIRYCGEDGRVISKIAFINGSGTSLIKSIPYDFDCLITGDVGYHAMKEAELSGYAMIDAGHFETESIFKVFLKDAILDCLTNIGSDNVFKVEISESERTPFRYQ